MNKKAKIFLIATTIIAIAVGIGVYKYNHPATGTTLSGLKQSEVKQVTDDVSNNLKVTKETKTVRFKTEKEMADYAKSVNNIKDLNEASVFIKGFYNDAQKSNPINLIPYYYPEIRQTIENKLLFPFYDGQNLFNCEISNIDIKEDDKNNNYTVTYTMKLSKKTDNSLYATVQRQDKLHLTKSYEKIYILYYTRHTVSSVKS